MSRASKALDVIPVEYTRDAVGLIFEVSVPVQESDDRLLFLLTRFDLEIMRKMCYIFH